MAFPVVPPKVMPPREYQWRPTGRAGDGGEMVQDGPNPEEMAAALEEIGYRVVKIERREITAWETLAESDAGIKVEFREVATVELARGV